MCSQVSGLHPSTKSFLPCHFGGPINIQCVLCRFN